jgi:hypothetical protein
VVVVGVVGASARGKGELGTALLTEGSDLGVPRTWASGGGDNGGAQPQPPAGVQLVYQPLRGRLLLLLEGPLDSTCLHKLAGACCA